MEYDSPERLFPFNLDRVLRRGLGRTLLFSFFGLAIIPMALVGTISYHLANKHLTQEIQRNIRSASELNRRQLQDFFDVRSADTKWPDLENTSADFSTSVNQMLKTPLERGDGYHVYILDIDLKKLAGTTGLPEFDNHTTIDTELTHLWRKNQNIGNSELRLPAPFTYSGPGGNIVIGTYTEIRLGEFPYALIVEIDQQTAFGILHRFRTMMINLVLLIGLGALAVSTVLARTIVGPFHDLSKKALAAASGQLDHDMRVTADNEIGELSTTLAQMIDHFRAIKSDNDNLSKRISGLADLHRIIGGEIEPDALCLNALEFLSDFLDLSQADFFVAKEDGELACIGRFPGYPNGERQQVVYPGNRQVGQNALGKAIISLRKDSPDGLVSPVSSVELANLIAVPLVWRQRIEGILELEKTGRFNQADCQFMEVAAEVIAVALNSALTRKQEAALLDRTRKQTKKLKLRKTALETSTHELQAQSRAFQTAEQKLQLKQLELEAANAQMEKNASDLEAHMAILENQKREMKNQNTELEKSHRELKEKARQLEVSSRYKTQFMANMSHELRTPLNSILLLSRLLMENKEKTLTEKQFEFSHTIHSAGEDLLNLINEILDLAKVESGKMEVALAPVKVRSITDTMQVSFAPLAEQRGVAFTVHVAPEAPTILVTDRKRIEQIVKNFLSNAFKFTTKGAIRLEIAVSRDKVLCGLTGNSRNNGCLTISVVDTGIGIPADKHQMVFEAFQQVDGSTRREYDGTGLGLSISRELARLLGGVITLRSQAGQGSRFTLHLPIIQRADEAPTVNRTEMRKDSPIQAIVPSFLPDEIDSSTRMDPVPDDRNRLSPGDSSILIIDADTGTAEPIKDHAHQNGYKVIVAEKFQTGLHFADYYLPTAIFANLQLPGADCWTMIRRIKANPRTRHTPVFSFSPQEDGFAAAVHGAAGHVTVPLTSRRLKAAFKRIEHLRSANRRILALAPDSDRIAQITNAFSGQSIDIMVSTTASKAKAILQGRSMHAVILHPALDATEQHSFLISLEHNPIPVFLYSGDPLDAFAQASLGQYGKSVNLEMINTPENLLLSLVTRLHLPTEALNNTQRERLRAMDRRQTGFKGRKVLLVDDDMRTVFAVSNVLEDQGAEVITGKTGKESLDKLDSFPDIDLILMDVMIAEVDGYQAIREVRKKDRYRTLPIIALTGKAMKGDRSKCIEAGSDDYLAKPVNLEKLTSMLKIWFDPQPTDPKPVGAWK